MSPFIFHVKLRLKVVIPLVKLLNSDLDTSMFPQRAPHLNNHFTLFQGGGVWGVQKSYDEWLKKEGVGLKGRES